MVLILGTVNVNRVCAWYNYDSYMTGRLRSVDVEAIYNLGHEGIPYITNLADDVDPDVARAAKHYLAKAYLQDYFYGETETGNSTDANLQKREMNSEVSKFSLPRAKAYESLYEYLEKHPGFGERCREYFSE